MTQAQFTNALRILYSLDAHELGDPDWWEAFAPHPFRYLMGCDAERAEIIWRAMVKRGAGDRLSDAAPQMLEALQQIHFYETVHDPNRGELFSGALHAVERAIEAATGEKPKPGGTR